VAIIAGAGLQPGPERYEASYKLASAGSKSQKSKVKTF